MKSNFLAWLTISLLLLPIAAHSALITYDFTAQDSQAGVVSHGYFSFDDSIIPAGGGSVMETGLFSSLNFTWRGVSYNQSTANTGILWFTAEGDLSSWIFGNNCFAGGCIYGQNTNFWVILGPQIEYYEGLDYRTGAVTMTRRETVTTVPAPGTLVLIGFCFAGLAFSRRRVFQSRKLL